MKNEYLRKGRTKQKIETRESILIAAQDLINQGDKFTLEDVATKSGMSRATVYRYYSNVETLIAEAGLNIKTRSPESIYEEFNHFDLEDQLMGVQHYYNRLALDYENAFRHYLSTTLSSGNQQGKRGARRNKTLQMVLTNTLLPKKEQKKLQNLLTVLMGIEPIIVTKDVCGLDNEQSQALLKWGMQLILKGLTFEDSYRK
ncbi:TetR/AcrR family transcriptional regulator [Subsaxibacter sp. CAU 1640]|uniref:TetR/AcrR family transcriptional regulator n=1 Tax=Subsaxibacter sp. CAU 1640 TaxID=2933271 RepID=UPI002003B034|nr:TetR/AcrR family transcriptional regulator [Subsaxibacter sp. CAU 1640]MCK7591515.1 TetR/AcrR family transcriptional regulator [Subsaxibacter sp. CAU 1640]